MFRTLSLPQLSYDAGLAVVAVLLRLAIGVDEVPMYLVLLAMASALALRRVSPTLALAVAWVGAVLQLSFGLNPDLANLAILPVLYATASYGPALIKWLGLASAGAGALTIAIYLSLRGVWYSGQCDFQLGASCLSSEQFPALTLSLIAIFFFALTVFILCWTFGLLAKTWRTARESRKAQAAAEAERLDARRDVVVEQERNRIARDMHDVVAHSLAVVIAQADGARYAQANDPEAVDTALSTISSTAREALGDVRILLGQLRHNQGEAPQPVLADLDRLLEQFRGSGLMIGYEVRGEPIALGTGHQLAVYRIVQEALTNALRHGDSSAEVLLRFDWSPDGIELSVSSALKEEAEPPSELGHGLAGMRERAALVGGWLTAEPSNGRFVVTAGLPVEGPSIEGEK